MDESGRRARFEEAMLPHLHAAFNLASWLLRNDADAEDAVQEAYLRAFRHFDGFRGGDGRVWVLAIVRNVCLSHWQKSRARAEDGFEEELHETARAAGDPEAQWQQKSEKISLDRALRQLPPDFREVVVLRELEELSYKEIAHITGAPIGTVMSRLARARALLRQILGGDAAVEAR